MSKRLTLVQNHLAHSAPHSLKANLQTPFVQDPLDFLNLSDNFTPEINQKRQLIRQALESQVEPLITEYYNKAQFPFEVIPVLQSLDLIGFATEGHGVRKQTPTEFAACFYEVSRIDASLGTFIVVSIHLCAKTIYLLGTEEQKEKYLKKLCNFEMIGAWGLTEPNFGSDASGLQTTAQPVDGGFILNGEKKWIGNAIMADIVIIFARNTQSNQIEGFILDTHSAGVTIRNVEPKLALRIVQNGHIEMNSVFVPENMKLTSTNFANGPNVILEHSRVFVPMLATGIMAQIYESSIKYTRDRVQFNSPLAAFQLSQEKLARLLSIFSSAFLLSMQSVKLVESGNSDVAKSSLIKGFVTKLGREAAHLGRELLGGNGILLEYKIMRCLADMEVAYTYEGTYDINMLVAARAITGISSFKSPFQLKN